MDNGGVLPSRPTGLCKADLAVSVNGRCFTAYAVNYVLLENRQTGGPLPYEAVLGYVYGRKAVFPPHKVADLDTVQWAMAGHCGWPNGGLNPSSMYSWLRRADVGTEKTRTKFNVTWRDYLP